MAKQRKSAEMCIRDRAMGMMYWATVAAVSPLRAISMMAGSFSRLPRFFWMELSMVCLLYTSRCV